MSSGIKIDKQLVKYFIAPTVRIDLVNIVDHIDYILMIEAFKLSCVKAALVYVKVV